jgi:lysophospholipase L1-like esterase
MNRYSRGLLFGVYLAVACLLGGELAVRGLYGTLRDYNMEMWRYASDIKLPLDRKDLPFHHRPDRAGTYYGVEIRTNSLGLRERELTPQKPPGERRVVMLGDSFTLGWGVPVEETFARRLEEMLRADGREYRVINMGTGNYNTVMEVELFKWKGLGLDPDVLVLMYFLNDTEPVPHAKSGPLLEVASHSYLFAFMFDRFTRLRSRLSSASRWDDYYAGLYSDSNAANLERNAEAVRELAALCRSHGIDMLIVSIPELHETGAYKFACATAHIERLARDLGVPFIDLLPSVSTQEPDSLWVGREDHHANARANAIFAERIYVGLLEGGMVN